MKSFIPLILILSVVISIFTCSQTVPAPVTPEKPETILDKRDHIEADLILDPPEIPRLCDAMDIEKKFVDIGDCKLYCAVEGTGTPMVLINGGPGDTHHIFHPWASEAAKEFKVIYYDQRGCGLSDYTPGEGYSFEQTIDDLEKLRIALGIDKWILAGHSFGGGIAQYYSIKYPERVIGQVLIASVPMVNRAEFRGGRGDQFYTAAEHEKIDDLRKKVMAREISMQQYIINRDLNGGWKRQYFHKPSRDRIIQNGLYDFVADPSYSSDWAAYELEHVFLESPVPTLVMEGKYDVVWRDDRIANMGKLHPKAKMVVFEKSGHNIFADEPVRFVNEIKTWMEQIKPATPLELKTWAQSVNELIGEQLVLIESSKKFLNHIRKAGVESARKQYDERISSQPATRIFFEAPMNALGYEYLFADKIVESIEIFRLNVSEYPDSWNAYDSLGEALLAGGEREQAIMNYKRSIELNPENENGIKVLAGLQKE